MEHESEGDYNCKCCIRYSHQRIGTGTGRLGDKRKRLARILKIDLRRLAVTHPPVF